MTDSSSDVIVPTPAASSTHDGFRPDIEGLRGLAVLVVVLFHAGLAGMAGGFVGVDVFFVISGFLITGLLLREHERTGRIGLLQFYARRARRLLPAALVVLVATLGASFLARGAPRSGGRRPGRRRRGPLVRQHPLRAGCGRLLLERVRPIAVPAFLEPRGRRAVLPRVAGPHPAGRPRRSRPARGSPSCSSPSWRPRSRPTSSSPTSPPTGRSTRSRRGPGSSASVACSRSVPAPWRAFPGRIVGLAGWLGLRAVGVATVAFDATLAYPGVAALLPGRRHGRPGRRRLAGAGSGQPAVDPADPIPGQDQLLALSRPLADPRPRADGHRRPGRRARRASGSSELSIVAAILSWALIETPFRTGLPSLAVRPGAHGLARIGCHARGHGRRGRSVARLRAQSRWRSRRPTPRRRRPSVVDEPWPARRPLPTPTDRSDAPGRRDAGRVTERRVRRPRPPPPGPTSSNTWRPAGDASSPHSPPRAPTRSVSAATAASPSSRRRSRRTASTATRTRRTRSRSSAIRMRPTWFPALERLAKHEGWRLVTFVKVACPFIDMRDPQYRAQARVPRVRRVQ